VSHWFSASFFAYIDPGGGEYLLQILMGSLLALVFQFRRIVMSWLPIGKARRPGGEDKSAEAAVEPSK